MDAKALYWKALGHFRTRNAEVLPQIQLQTGANERWFAREFTLAINRQLSEKWGPTVMRLHADCEYKFGDISVWNGTDPDALALYEVKVLYSDMSEASIQGVIDKGHRQLGGRAKMEANRKIGLFFSIYYAQGPSASHSQRRDTFEARVRNAVRTRFTSDHHIRMTELSHLAEIDYGSAGKPDPWHTMSWVTWGIPKE